MHGVALLNVGWCPRSLTWYVFWNVSTFENKVVCYYCGPQYPSRYRDSLGVGRSSVCGCLWPRGLRRGSAVDRLLGLRVRIPPGARMFVLYNKRRKSQDNQDKVTSTEEVPRETKRWNSRNNPGEGCVFFIRPDRRRSPPILLYNEYRVSFSGLKRPGRGVDHPSPCSAEVKTSRAIPLLSLWFFLTGYGVKFYFLITTRRKYTRTDYTCSCT